MDRKKEIQAYSAAIESIPQYKCFNAKQFPDNILTASVHNTVLVLETCRSLLSSDASDDRCIDFVGYVHRSFLSDAFLGIEFFFEALARESKLKVVSLDKRRAEEMVAELNEAGVVFKNKKLHKWLENKSKTKPGVMDIVHLVLDKLDIEGKEREEINKSIDALRILRNKSSHGLPFISDEEFQFLKDVNLPIDRDKDGFLLFRIGLYIRIIEWLEKFFEKVCSSSKMKINSTIEPASPEKLAAS